MTKKNKYLEMSINKLTKLAKKGDIEAQVTLGFLYYFGNNENNELHYYKESVQKDLELAFQFFKLAAENGNALAASQVSLMYEKGEGVSKDTKSSIFFQKIAADLGHPIEARCLGLSYLHGDGMKKNKELAIKYLTIASEHGDVIADKELRKLNKKEKLWKRKY